MSAWAPKESRNASRQRFTPEVNLSLINDDLDTNDRDHVAIRQEIADRYKEISRKMDRQTAAISSLALSAAGAAIALIFNLLQGRI